MSGKLNIAGTADVFVGPRGLGSDGIPAAHIGVKQRALLSGGLVFFGYYLGAKLGMALTFSPLSVSVMWPPNAILLAALLLNPPRRWWFLLACAFPAHLISEAQSGVPLGMMLCWFASNCFEALVGAVGTRYLLGPAMRFDKMRSMAILFLCAAFFAPLLSSFLDAAFVSLNHFGQQGYWQVWYVRFCSNVFTELAVVPVIVTWSAAEFAAQRAVPLRRVAETGAFFMGLAIASLGVFWWQKSGPATIPTLFYVPMPFLVWAAIRYGLPVTSTSILAVALLAIWGAVHERGPFASFQAQDDALFIQIYFVVVATALMFLATSITEHRKAEERFVKAFSSSPDAIAISRLADGKILEVNKRWEKMLGYSRGETIGRTVFDLNIYVSELDRQRLLGELQSGNEIHDLELSLRMKGGEIRQMLISADTDEIAGEKCLFVVVRDVTERNRAVEQERARIAEDIHDDLGARLTGITMLSDLSRSRANNAREVRSNISQIATQAQLCTQSLDEIVWAVNPQQDSLTSFVNYLQAHASEVMQLAEVRCRFQLPSPTPNRPLSSKLRHNLFMACRETLNNVVKHAAATEVWLRIQFLDEQLTVTIMDNGCGFEEVPSPATSAGMRGHNGLSNLRRRLETVGGSFEIKSQPKAGTTVVLSVNLRNADALARPGLGVFEGGNFGFD